MLRTVIICLGDSLTWGSRDEPIEGRGYPACLETMLSEKQPAICLNKGVTRETSVDTARRAYDVFRSYPESNLALVLTGTNDLKGQPSGGHYYWNMKSIVTAARVCGKRVIVGTIPAISSERMWCFPRNVMDGVKTYNLILESLSKSENVPLCDFSGMEEYLVDGVHFGYYGYLEMAMRWEKAIKELI